MTLWGITDTFGSGAILDLGVEDTGDPKHYQRFVVLLSATESESIMKYWRV